MRTLLEIASAGSPLTLELETVFYRTLNWMEFSHLPILLLSTAPVGEIGSVTECNI